jgi:hypothetical protein
MEIIDYLAEVIKGTEATASQFEALEKPGVTVFPIPFFGRIDQALVLTVGVNPSATEFHNRAWPSSVQRRGQNSGGNPSNIPVWCF